MHHIRKLRKVSNGKHRGRVDLSLPLAALEAAGLKVGDLVDIHVTPSGRLIIAALRAGWPRLCGGLDGRCERPQGHLGECIPVGETPY